jgi:uncharacterized membrane protein YtjA (UPF0391 family)
MLRRTCDRNRTLSRPIPVPDPAGERGRVLSVDGRAARSAAMFRYAVIFLIISLVTGALGLANVSAVAKRISLILFAVFFLAFLILLAFAFLVGAAIDHAWLIPATVSLIEA